MRRRNSSRLVGAVCATATNARALRASLWMADLAGHGTSVLKLHHLERKDRAVALVIDDGTFGFFHVNFKQSNIEN